MSSFHNRLTKVNEKVKHDVETKKLAEKAAKSEICRFEVRVSYDE